MTDLNLHLYRAVGRLKLYDTKSTSTCKRTKYMRNSSARHRDALSCRTIYFSLSLPTQHVLHRRNTDPGSQSRLFSPLPTTVRAFTFIAKLTFSSLVDSLFSMYVFFLPRTLYLFSHHTFTFSRTANRLLHFSRFRAQLTYTAEHALTRTSSAHTHVREHSQVGGGA